MNVKSILKGMFRLVLNGSAQPVEIDNIMLDEIDDYFDCGRPFSSSSSSSFE